MVHAQNKNSNLTEVKLN